jgi:hypothetical protein
MDHELDYLQLLRQIEGAERQVARLERLLTVKESGPTHRVKIPHA